MEKVTIKQLFGKSTRRVRILTGLLISAVTIAGFVFYFGVVSPSFANAFSGAGEGTESVPYQIENCTQLQEVSEAPAAYYVLINDIDCSQNVTDNGGLGFVPIGNFSGSFDGRNYAINDLYVNRVAEVYSGLFATATGNAIIQNVSLKKTAVTAGPDISGAITVGALVGDFRGNRIVNVHSDLSVQAEGRDQDYDNLPDTSIRLGGLVGQNAGDISLSSSTGNVVVLPTDEPNRDATVGGLVGAIFSNGSGSDTLPSISDSFATGSVNGGTGDQTPAGSCGGLVGLAAIDGSSRYLNITRSYSTGAVTCIGSSNPNTGSFLGSASVSGQTGDTNGVPEITSNFAKGLVTGNNSGGFYGAVYQTVVDGPLTNFTTNKFDVTTTGKAACSSGGAPEQLCQGVNVGNSEPDYFSISNSTGFYTNWDQLTVWQLASPLPVHKTQTVITNAPSGLEITRDGNNFIADWDAPTGTNGRAVVDAYEVWYRNESDNSPNWTRYVPSGDAPITTLPVTLSGFTIPGSYTFKVRATTHNPLNITLFGLFSPDLEFNTGMPSAAPQNIIITPSTSTVDLSWDAVAESSTYDVQFRKVGDTEWISKVGTQNITSAKVYVASPASTYEFRVAAKNLAGYGPWSELQQATTTARQEYTVNNCQQLQDVSNDLAGNYSLTANIDCSEVPNFSLIGGSDQPFLGTFDGKGFTISNVTIEADTSAAGGEFVGVGLFGVTMGATIQNVTLRDSTIVGNFALAPSVDANGNGLPDVPDPEIDLSGIDYATNELGTDDIPTSAAEAQGLAGIFSNETQEAGNRIAQGTSITTQDLGVAAQQFPTFAVGGIAGVFIGGGTQSNVKVLDTVVQGTIAGSIYGAIVPTPNIRDVPGLVTSSTNSNLSEQLTTDIIELLSNTEKTLTLNNFQSSGVVNGFVAGGIVGVGTSSTATMVGLEGDLVIQNSSSSTSVEANIGGGLMGAGVSLSIGSVAYAISSGYGQGLNDQQVNNLVAGAIDTLANTQAVVIKNSSSSGTVSACNAVSDFRMGSLGGLIGIGVGVSIQQSSASGAVSTCSRMETPGTLYGGATGGLAGTLLTSRIQNSYSTAVVSANRNPQADKPEAGIYLGASGGLAGVMVASDADEADGNFVVNNSYSTGNVVVEGKGATIALSGGLFGIYAGTGTVNNSHSTSNVITATGPENRGALSMAGGLTGLTLGVDIGYLAKTLVSYPSVYQPSSGASITNSYATGAVTTNKRGKAGILALTGGATGLFLGSGNITSSYATGKISSDIPEDLVLTDYSDGATVTDFYFDEDYGTAISGGLVGSAFGLDAPGILSSALLGFGVMNESQMQTTQGLKILDTHATGEVKGNIVGGLIGSAENKVSVEKSYAEGAVRGEIVGGLVGQSGFTSMITDFALGSASFLLDGTPDQTPQEAIQSITRAGAAIESAMQAVGPVEINNTYTTSSVTAVPYSIDTTGFFANLPIGFDASTRFSVPLPTIAGGIVGLYAVPGGTVSNSYASGAVTVLPRKDPVEAERNVKLADIPSFAGGIFGIDIALARPSPSEIVDVLLRTDVDTNPLLLTDFIDKPASVQNVFSASTLTIPDTTFTGGTAGWLINPLEAMDKFYLGHDIVNRSGLYAASDQSKIFAVSNVHFDKSRITTVGCNGPNRPTLDVAQELVDEAAESTDLLPNNDYTPSLDGFQFALPDDTAEDINSILGPQTSCQFVNANNSQPNYFKNNKTNSPMNVWNFSDVWKLKKDGYPVFVAGVTTTTPNVPNTPTDTPSGTGTNTQAPVTNVTQEQQQNYKEGTRNIARKLGFNRDQEQVKGLKAILARMPLFLARSIPYSLVLLLLILATMYSYQALREYRQLKVYHANIMRIVNTKESIDNYLAITTHYLNTPVAIMGGAVELMTSLKKVSAAKAASLQNKIRKFADASAELLTANQVSNALSANDEKLIRHEQPSPFKAKAVWVPALIALSLIATANVLFIYADMFNRSPYRIFVELGLYALGVLLVGLAYRYRNFMTAAKELARQRLTMESQLYKKREAFIPVAIEVVSEHYDNLKVASESLKKVPESRLFFNGLNMLGGINKGLLGIKQFASFESDPPLFDISTYIKKAIHDQSSKNADKKLTFDAKISPGLLSRIHPEEVKQITDSLLSNAVKFSKDGGNIQVQAYRRFNKLVLSVSDDGVGISAQKLPSLLKPFSRGTESMEYNYEGLGLDLYTDKIIVERQGGTISIQSELGKGTLATISLPMTRAPKSAIAPVLIMPEATAA